jgi:hypothetical protein
MGIDRSRAFVFALMVDAFVGGCAKTPEAGGLPISGVDALPASIDQLLALTQGCATVASRHDYALDDRTRAPICALKGAVYWTADMDVDCDGQPTADKCGPDKRLDCCYQPDTALHNGQDRPLTAAVTPYVVIPSDFSYPGLILGAAVAVIYKGQIQYAVFGDTGPTDIIGEASYACAEKLGIPPSALDGGVGGKVVTYIAFLGNGTVPRDVEDQATTKALGEILAGRLVAENH